MFMHHLLLGTTLAIVALPAAAQTAAPVVKVAQGKVSGTQGRGYAAFLGIHYGADTGGANRFRAPRPAPRWTGTRQATAFGNRCPQPSLNKPGALMSLSELPTSEDCLDLNVWTPAAKKGARRPVMVWLHGGAFGFGSSADPYYDGSTLAKKEGVVVVSVNHRLNGFGYLDLGPAAKGAFDANAGQLDIVLALQWVRDNIEQFGGDPANVTLFGQSGGASKITTLMGMPAARGLFHKAIAESGAIPRAMTSEEATAIRGQVLAAAGLKPEDVLRLRDLPADQLVAAFAKAGLLNFRPVLDEATLPAHPFDPASPLAADVPLMIGNTKDEATSILINDPSWAATEDNKLMLMATIVAGPTFAQEAVALYRARAPQDKPMHLLASIMTDQFFAHNTALVAERKAAQRAPVYVYRIDWRSPVQDGVLRAPHAVEVPFVFDTVGPDDKFVGNGESQQRMTDLMRSTFATFARTGNPNGKGRPAWPAYDAKTRATFIFNDPPSVVNDPDPELRAFWNKVEAAKQK